MKTVAIKWKAFGGDASISFLLDDLGVSDLDICEGIYKDTNTYSGSAWDSLIKPLLPADRTHTALSVGDEVTIDGVTYICADMGFLPIEEADIRTAVSDQGRTVICFVRRKSLVTELNLGKGE